MPSSTIDSRRTLNASTIRIPSVTSLPVDAVSRVASFRMRSYHQITTATAASWGNSVSSWSVWPRYSGDVANTATSAIAGGHPRRRRTMPCNNTSHTQNVATPTSLRRS